MMQKKRTVLIFVDCLLMDFKRVMFQTGIYREIVRFSFKHFSSVVTSAFSIENSISNLF